LIRSLARLPGVGEKTADRLAMHILRAPKKEAEELARNILDVKETVRLCSVCCALADVDPCAICRDPARERHLLCVVEQPADMVAVEKAGAFRGRYHVLQGVLSPMDGQGPEQIRIQELLQRIPKEQIEEVVIATSTSVEGEATAAYLGQCLQAYPVRVTRIASGIPVGGDLKYTDAVTLKRAMDGRRAL